MIRKKTTGEWEKGVAQQYLVDQRLVRTWASATTYYTATPYTLKQTQSRYQHTNLGLLKLQLQVETMNRPSEKETATATVGRIWLSVEFDKTAKTAATKHSTVPEHDH